MGVTVERISAGDGKNFPKAGDQVAIHCELCTFAQNEVIGRYLKEGIQCSLR